jgi:hypothetical protein
MPILEFLCPNGHKIRCDADRAGHSAQCAGCGAKFLVPDANGSHVSRSDALVRSGLDTTGLANEPLPPQKAKPQEEPELEFLCPNGHRLFGPAHLAGHSGECPDCGARFHIPSGEAISFPQEPTSPPHASQANRHLGPTAEPLRESRASPGEDLAQQAWEDEIMPATVWSIASGAALADQPLATLFARLWTTRPSGARIEIQLRDGEEIAVEQFMTKLSQLSHGVFGVRAPDTTCTIIAVAWDTIARISVRGLLEMPN